MMKKLILTLIAALVLTGCSSTGTVRETEKQTESEKQTETEKATEAEKTTETETSALTKEETNTTVIEFKSNITTGYEWTGFVLSGEAVMDEGTYIPDPNPGRMVGSGGKTVFTVTADQPGESIAVFEYRRSWEDSAIDDAVILISVDEDLQIKTMDITDSGALTGSVVSVDKDAHSVMIIHDVQGEVICTFAEDAELPVEGETVTVYTNGAMTMSLPPIVNVLAWKTVPDEAARDLLQADPQSGLQGQKEDQEEGQEKK